MKIFALLIAAQLSATLQGYVAKEDNTDSLEHVRIQVKIKPEELKADEAEGVMGIVVNIDTIVTYISPHSDAHDYVKVGDKILAVDDVSVFTNLQTMRLGQGAPHSVVTLTVERVMPDGERKIGQVRFHRTAKSVFDLQFQENYGGNSTDRIWRF